MSNLRYRAQSYAPVRRAPRMPSARNLIITMLAVFLVVTVIILGLGDLPARPGPETYTGLTYRDLKVQDERLLTTYGWVNQQEGVVRIPIDRAIDLVAERGLPVRSEAQQATTP